jgi:predicted acylesterase/phospholipase RssA
MANKIIITPNPAADLAGNVIASMVFSAAVFLFTGCAATRYEPSDIYPYCGMAYQECAVDLKNYKSPQQRMGAQDANLALAIAISGGGFRASNFSAGVLVGLEEINAPSTNQGNCLSQADYFSTVSGGGFTASVYISSLYDYIQFTGSIEGYCFAKALQDTSENRTTARNCLLDNISIQNYSTDPCIKRHLQGFYPDDIRYLISDILCWLLQNISKGGKFEEITDDTFIGCQFRRLKLKSLNQQNQKTSLTLGDIFIRIDDSNEIRLPYWVANATAYENGAIFPFTPDHLKLYNITEYRHRSKQYSYNPQKQSYESFLYNVPVAVAVMASANFPGATFPTTLGSKMDPNNPYLHLFDGGMADNLAVITAVRLLDDEQEKRVQRKVLLVIDAYQGTFAPFSKIRYPPPPVSTALRAMDISLDSWRGRYREIICGLCKEKNISVVFFSFDDLVFLESCQPLVEFGLTDDDIGELTEKSKLVRPFDLLRNIPIIKTEDKGIFSNAEQNLLISAGRFVVWCKRDQILSALNW